MKGTLTKTEEGWRVKYLQSEPKYIGERQSLQEIPIYPDYIALCSYIFYEGKEVEFEIVRGIDVLYAHLFKINHITEVIEEDAKDGLYENNTNEIVSDTYTGEYPFPKQETLYTREQVMEEIIGFQIFLNNKGLITNHDWDYEALAKKYIKSLKNYKKD
jgi:hypothetical protein